MIGRQLDRIDRTVKPAQVADLAVQLVRDNGMPSGRVHPQHVRGANFHAGLAANAAMNSCHRHFHHSLAPKDGPCCRL